MSEVAVIFLLVMANGVFAGAEIAVVALRRARMEDLAENGHGGARAVLALRSDPERFLATVQVGITVIGAAAAAFGGSALATRLARVLARFAWLEEHAEGAALAIVIAGISYLSVVIGELVPKSLALRGAERYALLVARPLLGLSWLARPMVWLLSCSANILLKPFGDKTTFTETRHSAEELRELVEEASAAGTISVEAGEIAARALELPQLRAVDVMVPRQNVVAISRRASREELKRVLLEHRYSRLPVYDGGVDNVVGYIRAKDMLALAWERELVVFEDVIRPAYFVPETKRVVDLMTEMRAQHVPFAVVVDEHGGVSGIVTLEDVLEELVGEIFSEHVKRTPATIERYPDGSFLVGGMIPIRDVNRALGTELPDEGDYSTLAGLVLLLAGRMPTAGESFSDPSGVRLEVVEASPRRIRAVRVYAAPAK